ncbi:helix-turn-helix transcriptional regulator [Aquimarina sp. RZ0]|uniref:helix-turn-helix transcriptional regulator n=1 Tax=Aquimarina sp. RZ0 TaxID=2607730 RepID=UPI0011F23F90|nr:helix-turn-helix transcriptional regulator [Aquimarina sp. RZ0]KAA1245201.1 helix-turn-helix domain-containing protein [Aquimarina sp. RZ0]
MKFLGSIKEYLQLEVIDHTRCSVLKESIESSLTVLWFTEDTNELIIDGKQCFFKRDNIVFLTEFHRVVAKNIGQIRFLRFNRPFYCILDHDTEVGCKGILFFGASQLPIIKIPKEEIDKFETLWKMFSIEMESDDSLQIEMLQMMLKRYLILCARVYKSQENYPDKKADSDIVREFNFLVEQHFKQKHTVTQYAELLYKSPKTLSNIFSKIGFKTPLQYIQDRVMLEAKRLLRYTTLHIKEIAFEIGFDDIQTFSRFFKKHEGVSPSEFKQNIAKEELPTLKE